MPRFGKPNLTGKASRGSNRPGRIKLVVEWEKICWTCGDEGHDDGGYFEIEAGLHHLQKLKAKVTEKELTKPKEAQVPKSGPTKRQFKGKKA
jgi:hypothetical protein